MVFLNCSYYSSYYFSYFFDHFQKLLAPAAITLCFASLISCAQLHHVQIGDINNNSDYVNKPFDIKISEVGINTNEAAQTAKIFLDRSGRETVNQVAGVLGLFQMGPRTGNTVYTKNYAKNLIQLIYEKCPSGKVTGLMSVRETRKYPVVSGEIVKVTGYCMIRKGS